MNVGGRSSTTLRSGYLKIGYQNWQREEEQRKDSSIVCESKISQSILVPSSNSKDIQEKVPLNLRCKTDHILIPKGFTDYLHHVGNANELNSILRNGLIPGGMSLKRGRQAVFFTTVNPMEDENCVEETSCDFDKSQGLFHTRILGNLIRIQSIGAI